VTRVAILGTGPAAAQIGCEFALGGCSVLWAEDGEGAEQRVEEALRLVAAYGFADPPELERARSLMARGEATISSVERLSLILDARSVAPGERAAALRQIAARHPEALVASTALLPSATELGEAVGAGERMLAMRYGEPPLLSPVVELQAARDTPGRLVDRVSQLLRALGKRPLVLRREVPGLVSGRLELALLRESAWLLERGVVDPEALDELVRSSLARRWSLAGPVEAAALGGIDELAELSPAVPPERPSGLETRASHGDAETTAALRERRDQGLAAALRAERASPQRRAAGGA
jgi:3-hydroxybutyryl-CoA dehydrogenase